MDWFLYDRDLRHERVKSKLEIFNLKTIFVKLILIYTRVQISYELDQGFNSRFKKPYFKISQPSFICSKSTIEAPERRSNVFLVNFEKISHIVSGVSLLT